MIILPASTFGVVTIKPPIMTPNPPKPVRTAKIPIIVLSNLGQKSDVQKALKLGASDYLIKAHFTTDDIISKVKKHLKE